MRFIKLTDLDTGYPLLVNADQISMVRVNSWGYRCLWVRGQSCEKRIKETVDEVQELANGHPIIGNNP